MAERRLEQVWLPSSLVTLLRSLALPISLTLPPSRGFPRRRGAWFERRTVVRVLACLCWGGIFPNPLARPSQSPPITASPSHCPNTYTFP
ncbi:hypothetical protein BT93_K1344 [Corymbia citriodora subsp. variegata]|nr:hypothetical protein BT93_K1344 [Corymbia citriodora subsp. variegata]